MNTRSPDAGKALACEVPGKKHHIIVKLLTPELFRAEIYANAVNIFPAEVNSFYLLFFFFLVFVPRFRCAAIANTAVSDESLLRALK